MVIKGLHKAVELNFLGIHIFYKGGYIFFMEELKLRKNEYKFKKFIHLLKQWNDFLAYSFALKNQLLNQSSFGPLVMIEAFNHGFA